MSSLGQARRDTSVKLYQETAALLRRAIETGRWRAGERLPSLEGIAADFEVSLITVRQAVALLRDEGLLISRHGVGTFVPVGLKDKTWIDLKWGFHEDSGRQAFVHHTAKVLEEDLDASLASVEDGNGYVYLKRIHVRKKVPYAVVSMHIDRNLFSEFPDRYRREMVLPLIFETASDRVQSASQTLTIGTADVDVARHLNIKRNAPIGELSRNVIGCGGRVIFQSHAYYRGDIVRLETKMDGISLLAPALS